MTKKDKKEINEALDISKKFLQKAIDLLIDTPGNPEQVALAVKVTEEIAFCKGKIDAIKIILN